jgi:phosphocarrier protein FPr
LAVAGGTGPDRQDFGTDATEIAAAIQSIYTADGVVVLMDLGSAVLSAELALEFLPQAMREQVVLCPGALVEGGLTAGVQAGLGSDLQVVCQEARRALQPKSEHLEGSSREDQLGIPLVVSDQVSQPENAHIIEVTLSNPHGLHARPAARFVQLAASFDAQVEVANLSTGKGPVSARSLNALATLGAQRGHHIAIRAWGPQASAALEALDHLASSGFGESSMGAVVTPSVETPRVSQPILGESVRGIPVSEGFACGPAIIYRLPQLIAPTTRIDDPISDRARLDNALTIVQRAISAKQESLQTQIGPDQASIFDAHRLILQDPDLLTRTRDRIDSDHLNAAAAWQASIAELVREYQELEDPYLRARGIDVLDVGDQVLRVLLGVERRPPIQLTGPGILFAEELSPGETASLDPDLVLGLIIARGGPTAHSSILARALGLPALIGVDLLRLGVESGAQIAIDGGAGMVWIEPGEEVVHELEERRRTWLSERQALLESSHAPAQTQDGHGVEVVANVGSLATAQAAMLNGAQGIGVLRTEFLYLDREAPPSEEEQVAVLQEIGNILGGQPIIVRTLDIGGDKTLRYINMPQEANPYLGVRGLRLSLRQPELFLVQLRAILRAGVNYPLRVMFPMVSDLEELLQAREYLEQVHRSLENERLPHRWPVEMGIMVEVPAVALISLRLAPYVDFFSIGTNDLTQYTLAAERGNRELANLADALHPAVLSLIRQVVEAAHLHGKWAGVCGEVASDPLAVPFLIGLEVDELSMNPVDIPAVKQAIRRVDFKRARKLAEQALVCESAAQVRSLVSQASSATIPPSVSSAF